VLCVQVLLNLLIALMGSIYEEEQENSANHRRAERASMILEIVRAGIPRCANAATMPFSPPVPRQQESQMSDDERRNTDFFPEHLHVLREKLDGETCATTLACCSAR